MLLYVKDYFSSKKYFNYAVTCNLQIQFEYWSEHFTDKKVLLMKEMLSDIVVKTSRASKHDSAFTPVHTIHSTGMRQ